MTIDLSLYLVTDASQAARAGAGILNVVRGAVAGGVTAVQVREKDASAREFLDTVEAIARLVPSEVAVIVNDRVDVFLAARERGARVSGVHVGQSDLPVSAVRAMVGPGAVIGLSASTPAELADADGADYVGIGAVHETRTKKDAPAALGIAGFQRLRAGAARPAVAIGGITVTDLAELRKAGAAGVAVVSAICAASNPEAAARELRAAWGAAT